MALELRPEELYIQSKPVSCANGLLHPQSIECDGR